MTPAEMIAAGLSPGLNPRNLRLYSGGSEQAIRVAGEDDGRLDSGDAVEFYGTGADTRWSGTRRGTSV